MTTVPVPRCPLPLTIREVSFSCRGFGGVGTLLLPQLPLTSRCKGAVLGQTAQCLLVLNLLRDVLGGLGGHIQGVELYGSDNKWMDRHGVGQNQTSAIHSHRPCHSNTNLTSSLPGLLIPSPDGRTRRAAITTRHKSWARAVPHLV